MPAAHAECQTESFFYVDDLFKETDPTGMVFFALAVTTIFVFRKQDTENDLRFRVPFYPWLPIVFILICSGLAFNTFLAKKEPWMNFASKDPSRLYCKDRRVCS